MERLNLILHAGANPVQREQIWNAPIPQPEGRHHPLPHQTFLESVDNALKTQGFKIASEAFGMLPNGQRMFGMMQIENEDDTDFATVFGFRNAHDKSFRASCSIGTGVMVCDNLSFYGEMVIGHKNTSRIELNLPGRMADLVATLAVKRQDLIQRINSYKTYELTDMQADHLTMNLFRNDLINTREISTVVEEWESPRHPEFAVDGKTGWRYFNAVTEALKGKVGQNPRLTYGLHRELDRVVSVQ